MSKNRAILELLIADLLWGFAFVAVPMAQKTWDSSQISFIRFAVPVALSLIVGLFLKQWRMNRTEWKLGLIPGFCFAATIYTQTIGLEYTTPSKSSFITVLYVVFVPILETYLHRKKLSWPFWIALLSALFGLALLFNLEWTNWNFGDTITLLCALFATWHIHQVGVVGRRYRSPIIFNVSQCFWACVLLIPFTLATQRPWIPEEWNREALFGMMMITFGATGIAFTIQVRVQKYLSLSTSAMLFLLESPIAMFFSWLIIKEPITGLQLTGALILLIALGFAVKHSGVEKVV
jgi:drug/metabolite transporter (DMT)-like permease